MKYTTWENHQAELQRETAIVALEEEVYVVKLNTCNILTHKTLSWPKKTRIQQLRYKWSIWNPSVLTNPRWQGFCRPPYVKVGRHAPLQVYCKPSPAMDTRMSEPLRTWSKITQLRQLSQVQNYPVCHSNIMIRCYDQMSKVWFFWSLHLTLENHPFSCPPPSDRSAASWNFMAIPAKHAKSWSSARRISASNGVKRTSGVSWEFLQRLVDGAAATKTVAFLRWYIGDEKKLPICSHSCMMFCEDCSKPQATYSWWIIGPFRFFWANYHRVVLFWVWVMSLNTRSNLVGLKFLHDLE